MLAEATEAAGRSARREGRRRLVVHGATGAGEAGRLSGNVSMGFNSSEAGTVVDAGAGRWIAGVATAEAGALRPCEQLE